MSTLSQAQVANAAESTAIPSEDRARYETRINLGPLLNAAGNLEQIDRFLGNQTIRASAFMAQSRFYWQVPYYNQQPNRHRSWDMLLRLYCDFRIRTQWYGGEAKGEISYYIVPYLNGAGRLGAYVDAWSYNQSGGGPFCTGEINDVLRSTVPQGIGFLQRVLDGALADLVDASFSSVYLLPGNGARHYGNTPGHADVDASIAAIP